MSFTWNSVPSKRVRAVISGAYLRQQAELLIAMSRTTFDLGVAARLREMASQFQARAAEQEHDAECTSPDSEMAKFELRTRS
jgi:hypothetical protein